MIFGPTVVRDKKLKERNRMADRIIHFQDYLNEEGENYKTVITYYDNYSGRYAGTDKHYNLDNGIYGHKAYDENDEAQFIADTIKKDHAETGSYSRNAVLYRMNAQSNIIERALVKANIPYRVYGGMRFYDRKEIKDIISYLAFINNPNDMLRFRRIINEPKRGIGDSTIALIDDISRDLKLNAYEVITH